ncbi:MAG: para-nitrobenzyl esterase [Actinomycetota bacterium]
MVVETLGIRFAIVERFAPPQLLPFDGTSLGRYGDACPQPPGEVFMTSGMQTNEDCLFLNVWTPSRDGRRPVMVWIHGGGYRQGSGDHFLSRGPMLAERGDVVVVTLNYRLGALGFLGGTNAGLLDQQCALQWVRANIADFGGDPDNVTLFGESAGSGSVGMQLVMPSSRGLFERAVMQSGAGWPITRDRAERMESELADACGTTVDRLRDVDADALVDAQTRVEAGHGGMVFVPTIDGDVVLDGAPHAAVPLIVGSNVDEVRLMAFGDPKRAELTEEQVRRRLERSLGDGLDDVIDTVRTARVDRGEPVTWSDLWYAIQTDVFFRVPALRFADAHAAVAPTFTYLFGWRSPALDGWLGACHVLEIPFVFGLHGGNLAYLTGEGPEADALSARMLGDWVDHASGKEPWERHDPATRPTMYYDAESRLELAPREPERAIVDRYLV